MLCAFTRYGKGKGGGRESRFATETYNMMSPRRTLKLLFSRAFEVANISESQLEGSGGGGLHPSLLKLLMLLGMRC